MVLTQCTAWDRKGLKQNGTDEEVERQQKGERKVTLDDFMTIRSVGAGAPKARRAYLLRSPPLLAITVAKLVP